MPNILECYIAYSDKRFNRIRVIHCLLSVVPGSDIALSERLTVKAIEKASEIDAYINRYYFVPSSAFNSIETISIVNLLEGQMLYEPLIIHSPVQVTAVYADQANSVLKARINQMADTLRAATGKEPQITYEVLPEQFMPAELV